MKTALSDDVYNSLKNQILLNKLRPGEQIGEQALAEQFGVSRTPIRQALQRLQAAGLVCIRDGAGTFVTAPTKEETDAAYQIRCAMECLAIRTSINVITPEELDPLEDRFKSYKALFGQGGFGIPFEEMAFTDWALHDLIVNR